MASKVKLIIECYEQTYEECKRIQGLSETAFVIANGKVITDDCISRNALKATIIEPLNVNDAAKNDWHEGYYTAKNEDVYYIDNAPTIGGKDNDK